MPASVTIEDNEAEFEASEADERATLALCDLLEEADRGRMTLIELASRLRELTEAAPEHIDARAHLGSVLRESEQLQEAAAEYERAFEIGSKALPTDFDGRIEWIRLDNRPFLRAAYGLALVRLKTGKPAVPLRARPAPPPETEVGRGGDQPAARLRRQSVHRGNPLRQSGPDAAANLGGQQLARDGNCQGVRPGVRRIVAPDRRRSRVSAVAAHASTRDGRASGSHRMPAGTALGERLQRQRTNPGPGTSGV